MVGVECGRGFHSLRGGLLGTALFASGLGCRVKWSIGQE